MAHLAWGSTAKRYGGTQGFSDQLIPGKDDMPPLTSVATPQMLPL